MTILIRHLQEEDATAVHEMCSKQSVINGTMRLPYQSFAYTKQRVAPVNGVVRLVAVADDRVVGYAELITYPNVPRHRHCGEVNMIMVHEDWQNHGIGRQLMAALLDLADQWLQLTRLSLIVWTDNDRAIHLYKQMGFQIEGTMPEYAFRAGRYIDAFQMGRLSPSRAGVLHHREHKNQLEVVW
ncbi:GNAT family N-acetyltransferase [Candidatus Leptofilum sp.]|uniref:GNAT family N-acetyltransferase n=1 Tax=Candidatus Leptofilum sp. TaxID=3241576 RepID=UPI003B5CA7A1